MLDPGAGGEDAALAALAGDHRMVMSGLSTRRSRLQAVSSMWTGGNVKVSYYYYYYYSFSVRCFRCFAGQTFSP